MEFNPKHLLTGSDIASAADIGLDPKNLDLTGAASASAADIDFEAKPWLDGN